VMTTGLGLLRRHASSSSSKQQQQRSSVGDCDGDGDYICVYVNYRQHVQRLSETETLRSETASIEHSVSGQHSSRGRVIGG